jgi:hypothetical protein
MFALLLAHPVGLVLTLTTLAACAVFGFMPVQTGAFTKQQLQALLGSDAMALTVNGAVDPHTPQVYMLNKAGVLALTLAAPTAGSDDGVLLRFISTTANAHTITTPAAGNIQDGNNSGFNTVMTFNAHIGANCTLRAHNGTWYVLSEVGCALSS